MIVLCLEYLSSEMGVKTCLLPERLGLPATRFTPTYLTPSLQARSFFPVPPVLPAWPIAPAGIETGL